MFTTPKERERATAGSWPGLALCSTMHAAVDAGCGLLLWHSVRIGLVTADSAWASFAIYTALAFAVQPLLGALVDRLGAQWLSVGLGALMVAASLVTVSATGGFAPALALAGIGNAAFHVGGGRLSLQVAPGRATWPGIFVAPGAAGLALGVVAGRSGFPTWPIASALVALACAIPMVRHRQGSHSVGVPVHPIRTRPFAPVLGLLLLVVALRSYIGMGLALPWRGQLPLLVALTAGVVAGKALGGIAADRMGWRVVGCGSLLIAAPLLVAGPGHPVAGVLGMAVFNMTMPVTVAAAACLLPGDEGLAFGLTCLALFVGAVPALLGWAVPVGVGTLLAGTGIAVGALWWALRPAEDQPPERGSPRPDRTHARSQT